MEFRVGELVWAKMKGFSPWPGMVASPPEDLKKPSSKKPIHCVFFYGSENYAWIEETNIKPYLPYKEQLGKMNKSAAFKDAVDAIEKAFAEKGAKGEASANAEAADTDAVSEATSEGEGPSAPEGEAKTPKPKKRTSTAPKSSKRESTRSTTEGGSTKKRARKENGRAESPDLPLASIASSSAPQAKKVGSSTANSFLNRPSLLPGKPSYHNSLDVHKVSDTLKDKKIEPSTLQFGFLGLGTIGSGIVKNLLNSGHKVNVWNRSSDRRNIMPRVNPTNHVTEIRGYYAERAQTHWYVPKKGGPPTVEDAIRTNTKDLVFYWPHIFYNQEVKPQMYTTRHEVNRANATVCVAVSAVVCATIKDANEQRRMLKTKLPSFDAFRETDFNRFFNDAETDSVTPLKRCFPPDDRQVRAVRSFTASMEEEESRVALPPKRRAIIPKIKAGDEATLQALGCQVSPGSSKIIAGAQKEDTEHIILKAFDQMSARMKKLEDQSAQTSTQTKQLVDQMSLRMKQLEDAVTKMSEILATLTQTTSRNNSQPTRRIETDDEMIVSEDGGLTIKRSVFKSLETVDAGRYLASFLEGVFGMDKLPLVTQRASLLATQPNRVYISPKVVADMQEFILNNEETNIKDSPAITMMKIFRERITNKVGSAGKVFKKRTSLEMSCQQSDANTATNGADLLKKIRLGPATETTAEDSASSLPSKPPAVGELMQMTEDSTSCLPCVSQGMQKDGSDLSFAGTFTDALKDFIEAGATQLLTPADVVSSSDVTFSCLSDPQVVKELVFGNCGVLQGISQGKKYVEMTSIDAETSQDLHEGITAKGGQYLEAQIQGNKTKAEEGSLVILAAGDRNVFEECQSAFSAMGTSAFFLGEVGMATKLNLVLQLMMGVSMNALAEAFALADRAGLNQKDVLEVMELTQVSSPLLVEKGKAIIEGSFPSAMALSHMQKDLKLALNLGDQLEQPLPVTATANEVFKHAKRLGYADHDVSAVYIRARF